MKFIFTGLLGLFTIYLSGMATQLSGTLLHYNQDSISINIVTDYQVGDNWQSISIDQNGKFSIDLALNEPAFIHLYTKETKFEGNSRQFYNLLIVYPGNEIKLHVDFSKASINDASRPIAKWEGSNAAGHNLFSSYVGFPLSHHLDQFQKIIRDNTLSADQIFHDINSTLEKKFLFPYTSLLEQNAIDEFYYQVVINYIKAGLLALIIGDIYNPKLKILDQFPDDKLSLLTKLLKYAPTFKDVPILAKNIFFSTSHLFLYQKKANKKEINYVPKADTSLFFEGEKYDLPSPLGFTLNIQDSKLKEFFFASYLYFLYDTMRGMTEKFDSAFKYFRIKFPDSQYVNPILQLRNIRIREVMPTNLSLESEELGLHYQSWSYELIDEVGNMKDFTYSTNLVDISSGVYYVDIWATWCGPCISAMRYNYKVDSLLDQFGFKRLYLSIDNDFMKWMNTIENLNLGGYHVLVGDQLKELLHAEFGINAIAIPRYFFLKNGKIILNRAASPKEFDKLLLQIQKISKE